MAQTIGNHFLNISQVLRPICTSNQRQPKIGRRSAAVSDVSLKLNAGDIIAAPDTAAVIFSFVVSNK